MRISTNTAVAIRKIVMTDCSRRLIVYFIIDFLSPVEQTKGAASGNAAPSKDKLISLFQKGIACLISFRWR
jgi:hypothetical protein